MSPFSVGVSMIVRDGAATLERALRPFEGLVSEIVVADTGSTDGTRAILERFNATIVNFPWIDDFAAARNAALDRATADWIFSLDADEYVTRADAEEIVSLSATDACDGYLFDTINFIRTKDEGALPTEGEDCSIASWYFLSSKVRLARRGCRWTGRVHELLEVDGRARGMRYARSRVRIRHDGGLHAAHSDYYVRLAMRAYEEGTAHAGILNVLALEAIKKRDGTTAEKLFREAIAMEPGFASPVVWLGRVLHHTGRSAEAIRALQEGLVKCLDRGSLLAALIDIHFALKETNNVSVMAELAAKIVPGDPHVAAALRRANVRTPTS